MGSTTIDPEKTVEIENNYYFHNDKVILWLDKEKNEIKLNLKSTDHLLNEVTILKNLLKLSY